MNIKLSGLFIFVVVFTASCVGLVLVANSHSILFESLDKEREDSIKTKMNQVVSELTYEETFDELWENRYTKTNTPGSLSNWTTSLENGVYEFEKWENSSIGSKTIELENTNYDVLLRTNSTLTSNNTNGPLGDIVQTNQSFGRIGSLSTVQDFASTADASILDRTTGPIYFQTRSIAEKGGYVYSAEVFTAAYPRFNIFNALDPTNLSYSGDVQMTVGDPWDVQKDIYNNDILYLTGNAVSAYNISNPAVPVLISNSPTRSVRYEFSAQAGNYIYCIQNVDIMSVYDITDPTNILFVNDFAPSDILGANTIHYFDPYIYIATDYGVVVFDISNPESPFVKTSYLNTVSVVTNDVWVDIENDVGYLSTESNYINQLDLSDMNNIVSSQNITGFSTSSAISNISNNFLVVTDAQLVAEQRATLYFVDISNPDSPAVVQTLTDTVNLDYQQFSNILTISDDTIFVLSSLINSITSVNITGYTNAEITSYNGVSRVFPSFDLTNFFSLTNTATIRNATLQFDSLTTTNFGSTQLEVFIYDPDTGSNIIDNSSHTDSQLQTLWNNTLQPYNVSTFQTNITSPTKYLNVTNLTNNWRNKKASTNFLLGFGLQMNITSNNTEYLTFENITLFLQWDTQISDPTTASLQTSIEKATQFQSSVDFIYTKASTIESLTKTNSLTFQIAVETTNGTHLFNTHFFRALVYDPSGEVFLSWRDISGNTQSFNTGVVLTEGLGYRIVFDFAVTNSKLLVGIYDTRGNETLRSTSWSAYVSNEQTQKPSIFTNNPLEKDWLSNGTHIEKRGISLLVGVSSTYVLTGPSTFSIDRLYSSVGLLDEGFICDPNGRASAETDCQKSANDSDQFDHNEPLSATWQNLDLNKSESQFSRNIRDFRSFSGLNSFSNNLRFDPPNSYIQNSFSSIEVTPYLKDGSLASQSVKLQMFTTYIAGGFQHVFMNIFFINNVSYQLDFGGSRLSDSTPPPEMQVGYSFYFVDETTLALSVKTFNNTSDEPFVLSTFDNFDETVSHDVRIETQYTINGSISSGNLNSGQMGVIDPQFLFGPNLPFAQGEIPVPKEPWKKPPSTSWLDSLLRDPIGAFAGISLPNIPNVFGGLFNGFLDVLAFLGGIVADFVGAFFGFLFSAIGDVADFLVELVFWIFDEFIEPQFPGLGELLTAFFGFLFSLPETIIDILQLASVFIFPITIVVGFYLHMPLASMDYEELRRRYFMNVNPLRGTALGFPLPLGLVWWIAAVTYITAAGWSLY